MVEYMFKRKFNKYFGEDKAIWSHQMIYLVELVGKRKLFQDTIYKPQYLRVVSM